MGFNLAFKGLNFQFAADRGSLPATLLSIHIAFFLG